MPGTISADKIPAISLFQKNPSNRRQTLAIADDATEQIRIRINTLPRD